MTHPRDLTNRNLGMLGAAILVVLIAWTCANATPATSTRTIGGFSPIAGGRMARTATSCSAAP